MQKLLRLKKDEDFRRVRRQGRSWATPLLVLYALRTGTAETRVGFAVGKSLGKATVRNRVKRRLREAVRQEVANLAAGWDLVFIARGAAATATFAEIREAVRTLLKRAGVFVGPPVSGAEPTGGSSVPAEGPIGEGDATC